MAFFESDGMRACKIPFTLQFYSEINRKAQKMSRAMDYLKRDDTQIACVKFLKHKQTTDSVYISYKAMIAEFAMFKRK